MSYFINNDFSDILLSRQSVRHFDPTVKIEREEIKEMLSEAMTAPSACNLQPWHFVIIDTPEAKEKLRRFFMEFNTPQLETAATIVFIFGDTQAYRKYRAFWEKACEEGRISPEKRDEILSSFLPFFEPASYETLVHDAKTGSSLAAMQLMLIARAHGYDANALQGYHAEVAAETLGLDPERFVPCMAVAIGKADLPYLKKNESSVRYAVDEVSQFL